MLYNRFFILRDIVEGTIELPIDFGKLFHIMDDANKQTCMLGEISMVE